MRSLDDDNVLVRPVVPGSAIMIGELVTADRLYAVIPRSENRIVAALITPETVLRWLTGPSGQDPLLGSIRASVRETAWVIALRLLAKGLDADGQAANYPKRDRRLARETLAASHALSTARLGVSA